MFNKDGEKPKEGGESSGSGIKLPSVQIAGGEIKPQKINMPGGTAYGFKYVRKFAAGGQTGYRSVADGCAKRGKTRGKMV